MTLDRTIIITNGIKDDVNGHRREVESLWDGYARCDNRRVPMTFTCDEQVWLKISGHTFREFYADPEVHLYAQLQGKLWFCNNVIGDMLPGPPDKWDVGVQLWMEENEFFGCEVQYQEDDYAWGMPLQLGREDLLDYLADIDPEERVRTSNAYRMYLALKELSEHISFADRAVEIVPPGDSTHGIFTKAAEIRGIEQMCIDLVEAPDFAEKFLVLVTEKSIGRILAWHKLTRGTDLPLPNQEGFHFSDDSLQLISAEMYERFVLPCHERLYSSMTTGKRSMHICGRSSQLYGVLRRKLDVTEIDGPGPFVDHGAYLRDLGPDFSLVAQTDHSVMAIGTSSEIDRMVQGLLTAEAKVPGRFQILGFVTRHTPLENVSICYEAARKYGTVAWDL
jgi:hypothetical protein